jgi:polysaccharide biosynthesis protein PslH
VRVLFLTHRLPYAPNRGDRIRAHHLLRTLSAHADIDLVSLVHDEEEAGHAGALQPWVDSVRVAPVSRWRNLARCVPALATSLPLTHVMLDSYDVTPAIEEVCATRTPDVVLAYCSGMAKYIFSPLLRRIPSIVDMVDVDSSKWTALSRSAAPLKRWVLSREARQLAVFEAHAAEHAFATLTINERERQTLSTLAPAARVESVPNGIDYDFFKPAAGPSAQPNVVFVGVMNYAPNEQGAMWMVEHVWPRIRAMRPDARLSIVGSHPTPAIRRLQSAEHGITITGEVPDVRPYLWSAAVAVAPLQIARGLQNKVLEAVASGIPCVVTPTVAGGLPPQVLTACPTASEPAQFAGSVVDLLGRSPEERRAIAGSAHVESLNWPIQLAPVLTLLDEAARSRR